MKRRTIDMMIRHHRNSSLSSLGSGDWSSEVGASVEERSIGSHQSASSQSSRMRIVAEMAILASSSPEIKALTRRKADGFHASNMLPSPGSSVASSTVSRASISVTSVYDAEETKCQDIESNMTSTQTSADQPSSLSLDNLRIEPPPAPRRKQVSDIASLIDGESSKENSTRSYTNKTNGVEPTTNTKGQRTRRHSHAKRGNQRDGSGNTLAPAAGSQRPPKPFKSAVAATQRSPKRRPSMHRRLSFASLPTPSEIDASAAPQLYSSVSERNLNSSLSTYLSGSNASSTSDRSEKLQRRATTGTVRNIGRRNNNRTFYC